MLLILIILLKNKQTKFKKMSLEIRNFNILDIYNRQIFLFLLNYKSPKLIFKSSFNFMI